MTIRWTKAQLEAYQAKLAASRRGSAKPEATREHARKGREKDLQIRIWRYCEQQGWPVFHDFSRGKNPAGWPDLFVFLPHGQVLLVELKAAGGRLTKEQKLRRQMLAYLGHEMHVVRDFDRFLELARTGEQGAGTTSTAETAGTA